MSKVFRYMWQLPQLLLGYLVFLVELRRMDSTLSFKGKRVHFINSHRGGAFSLGEHIFIYRKQQPGSDFKLLLHEYGHSVQSLILGPFYLLVIAIPSLIWAGFLHSLMNKFTNISYYDFYTEKWADKLSHL